MLNRKYHNSSTISRFNNLTHFPKDLEKVNKDLEEFYDSEEKRVREAAKRYGHEELPIGVESALQYVFDAHHNYLLASVKAREAAPPWTVVGPANYKGNHEKADRAMRSGFNMINDGDENLRIHLYRISPRAAIKSSDPEAIFKLEEKILAAEKLQELMKAVNKIIKSKKFSDEEKIEKSSDLGVSAANVRELLKGDWGGRVGFASYELTNNNANIKRMKDRVEKLKELQGRESSEKEINGVTIVENVEAHRVQLFFDGKPAPEIRTFLKSRGFRWAHSVGAWQRHLSNQASYLAEEAANMV